MAPRVSPDGRQVAFSREMQGKVDLWLHDGAHASRVTFGNGSSVFPAWSPDGSRLAFESQVGPTPGFYQQLANGARAPEPLLLSDRAQYLSSWSPDGRYLLYFTFDPDTYPNVWVLPMTGDHKPFALLKTPFGKAWAQFSPDGRWLAYESGESGSNEVYVRRFIAPGDAADNTLRRQASGRCPRRAGFIRPGAQTARSFSTLIRQA